MEHWKIVKFCETATLAELRQKEEELRKALNAGQLVGTNANAVLSILKEHIALKAMFED